jgi:hypothetical protein
VTNRYGGFCGFTRRLRVRPKPERFSSFLKAGAGVEFPGFWLAKGTHVIAVPRVRAERSGVGLGRFRGAF